MRLRPPPLVRNGRLRGVRINRSSDKKVASADRQKETAQKKKRKPETAGDALFGYRRLVGQVLNGSAFFHYNPSKCTFPYQPKYEHFPIRD